MEYESAYMANSAKRSLSQNTAHSIAQLILIPLYTNGNLI
jgi:hypothetical protein